jgi:predicted nucleic acid-binding protein
MNVGVTFVDTGYWLALAVRSDALHEHAAALSARYRGPLTTTEPVLLEVGDALARVPLRSFAARLLAEIRSDPRTEVVPLTPDLFERAVRLYTSRPDKEWGLTDCVSFVVMEERGIHEALAADQHFVQAGFCALLRE